MRKLIAIKTCRVKRAWADAQRQTWVRDVVGKGYADVRFFMGAWDARIKSAACGDEVFLDVPDDYAGIPLKVRAICDWAVEHNYDQVSLCDDDVYVVPERYKTLPTEPFNYVGRFRPPYGTVYPPHFASGFFYTLSNRAAAFVAGTPWNGDWMDERFVATALAHWGIIGYHDPRNYMVTGPHMDAPAILSADIFRKGTAFCEYEPRAMYALHLAMRHLTPVAAHPGLIRQPQVVVTDEILASKPNDEITPHKRNRVYVSDGYRSH